MINSLLTGNVEPNAAVKVGAFGLERWLDLEAGAYGSDPHERRSDLVAVAQERAAARYGEPTGAVLVGDTPLDVLPRARPALAPWRWPPASPTSTRSGPQSPTRCFRT